MKKVKSQSKPKKPHRRHMIGKSAHKVKKNSTSSLTPLDQFDFSYRGEELEDEDYPDYNLLMDSIAADSEPRKRKRATDAEDLHDKPRKAFVKSEKSSSERLKFLLPVKAGDQVQMRYQQVEVEEGPGSTDGEAPVKQAVQDSAASVRSDPKYPTFSTDPSWKARVAALSFDVIENPEKNLKAVRELLSGLAEEEMETVRRNVIMASLVEIFKDILPGYRIHVASEVEKEQRMKKETLALQQHEQALVSLYQKFLQHLEKCCAVLSAKREVSADELSQASTAVKCMSQMLITHLDFNFRRNLISAMVRAATCSSKEPREMAVATLQRIFKQDRQGDATLDAVEFVSKIAKNGGQRLNLGLLEALLDIKISKELLEESRAKAAKPDRKTLSHAERKRAKEVARVEKELQASQVEENKKLKARLQTLVLQALFATYFRILRRGNDKIRTRLLPGVLKGVAKYAHFINIEYMDDLIRTLFEIIETPECPSLEGLLCVRTVFSVLYGQGSALNVDPHRFYEHMFKVMNSLGGTEDRIIVAEVLECVRQGFIERKKLVSVDRTGRCAKLVVNLALRSGTKEAISLVMLLRNLLIAHPRLESLLDSEHISNPVMPNMSDDSMPPGPLWELHVLRRHSSGLLKSFVDKLLGITKNVSGNVLAIASQDPVDFLLVDAVERYDM